MGSPPTPAATVADAAQRLVIRPMRTLWLLSIAHAVNHAQAVILPLIYIADHRRVRRRRRDDRVPRRVRSFASGAVQLSYASLTRRFQRRHLLGAGGLLFGGGFAPRRSPDVRRPSRSPTSLSRIGGSPQHPVGNGLLAEQFPPERRGFAISAHIAGGNVGTVVVALVGAPIIAAVGWRGASSCSASRRSSSRSRSCCSIRETGTDRAAAVASGTVRAAFGRIVHDRDMLLGLPDVGPRRRRARARRREPVRADLPDRRDRARPDPDRADVRRH